MMLVVAVISSLLSSFATAPATNGPPAVAVNDLGSHWSTTHHPGHEGHRRVSHSIAMQNDQITYAIRYTVCADKSHAPRVVPLEGYIGMPRPCACNWYHSGFLRLIIDGQDIGSYPLADFSALDSGQRGLCRLVWEYPGGRVRISFILDADANYLKCQILLQPKSPPKDLRLRLTCYPSYFTAYHKRKGARRVKTTSDLVKEGADKSLPAASNWWAVYYDKVFDVARGEGEGPCALLLNPAQATTIRIRPGDYAVTTDVVLKPDQRDIRLAFAEFPGIPNAQALKQWSTQASNILADLINTNFVPTIIVSTDFEAERRQLQDLIARARPAPTEAARLLKMLTAAANAATAARSGDWKAELNVAKLLSAYRDALWDLKIQALFAQ